MKNPVLFIHGGGEGAYEADRPLAESLQGALGVEYDVRYPAMPNERNPTYATWKDAIARELAAFERKAALVGHSFGASLLLKYAAEEPLDGRASGLFLIAAPFWRVEDWDVPEFALADDFAAKLPAELRLFFYHSRDDETVPFAHLAHYREALPSATFRELDARGHQLEDDLAEVAADVLLVR
ncbi:alpha/beta fold hydrolase [Sorangium sp. So ce394]|uniref:alpha/beta fold hydrolase n=1 Tax=Sorangium sp. So ce394 TaxID=3133310 RepID=UPI003F5BD349